MSSPDPTPPRLPASLGTLPADLLLIIADDLVTRDVGALRQTCKHVNDALVDDFTKDNFTDLLILCTTAGIAALKGICASRLASTVRTLSLSIFVIAGDDEQLALVGQTRVETSRHESDQSGRELRCPCLGDDTPLALALGDVIAALPHLETVSLGHQLDLPREADRVAAALIEDDYAWTTQPTVQPTGSLALRRQEPEWLKRKVAGYDKTITDSLFRAALFGLGRAHPRRLAAGYPPVLGLTVETRRSERIVVDDGAFALTPDQRALVAPALGALETLYLELGVWDTIGYRDEIINLPSFVALCGNVRHLRLHGPEYKGMLDALNWLVPNRKLGEQRKRVKAAARAFGRVRAAANKTPAVDSSAPAPLAQLESLDIQGFPALTASDVFELVVQHPNLRRLHLYSVTLMAPGDIHCELTSEFVPKLWHGLFTALSAQFKSNGSAPTTLLVSAMSQLHDDSRCYITIKDWEHYDAKGGWCIFSAGAKTAEWWEHPDGELEGVIPVEGDDVFLQAAACLTQPFEESEPEEDAPDYRYGTLFGRIPQ
ncbi:uncharacterized protein LOC62_07G009737 [Vanrija pseudolonga]|uniref:F-box domain-containing protein n=1 Tax=Vanrija pseudolonga TaxID=143232 RepID=A0AAF0YGM3_9TREE|nr:hypothetical protein LOC62_07G009737 [Vanrija pseudolonga]